MKKTCALTSVVPGAIRLKAAAQTTMANDKAAYQCVHLHV